MPFAQKFPHGEFPGIILAETGKSPMASASAHLEIKTFQIDQLDRVELEKKDRLIEIILIR